MKVGMMANLDTLSGSTGSIRGVITHLLMKATCGCNQMEMFSSKGHSFIPLQDWNVSMKSFGEMLKPNLWTGNTRDEAWS